MVEPTTPSLWYITVVIYAAHRKQNIYATHDCTFISCLPLFVLFFVKYFGSLLKIPQRVGTIFTLDG